MKKRIHPARYILPQILTWITGKQRYLPREVAEFEWTPGNWTHNAFRAYEWLFFKEYGVKPSATTNAWRDEFGRVYVRRSFHTVEALLAHVEGQIRVQAANIAAAIRGEEMPMMLLPRHAVIGATLVIFGIEMHFGGGSFMAPIVIGAVANDAATSSTATNSTSFSYNHTAAGSDRAAIEFHNTQAGDVTTGVTYGGSAMTQITKINGDTGSAGWYGYNYSYKRVAPATGSQAVVTSASGSGWMRGCVETFTGTDQTDPVDSFGTQNVNGTTNKPSITIVGSGVWICSAVMWDNSTPANVAGSNITKRAGTGADFQIGDSAGTVAAGATSNYGWTLNIGAQRSTVLNIGVRPPQSVQYNQDVFATTAVSASMLTPKTIVKSLDATATGSASVAMIKDFVRELSATATATAEVLKGLAMELVATATITADTLAQRAYLVAMNAAVAVSATTATAIEKVLSATANVSASIAKTFSVSQLLSATATISATIEAGREKLLEATVAVSSTIQTAIGKTLTANVSIIAKVFAPFWRTKYPSHGDAEDYDVKYPHD